MHEQDEKSKKAIEGDSATAATNEMSHNLQYSNK
jgi:hypothetical protein